ncbi:hypothetical protein B0A69_02470 [Chryseobacterium shigense]|uniref:HEAT repeat-containing protein n=1 Tax=Chryseobacterium shigense TaxID=297244 RepID=A0A1N7I8P8_9FLAO|nr:hypothetical protein [Chryseobacterium shigense]PQA96944.1 hypothetical protein B0A69_02470 [Chryseobacterium shigense]SIS33464.1 hypothetical protein SAMN05421639_102638 [Chryseobacterium shigense]
MKSPISLLLLLFFFCATSQVSKRTAAIIKPLEKEILFYSSDDQEIKKIEELLFKETSTEELVYLAEEGKNVYIKAAAVNVLANKKEGEKMLEVFKKNIHSKEKLKYRAGCIVSDYFLSVYIYEAIDGENNFSEKEKDNLHSEMVSIALNTDPVNTDLLEALTSDLPLDDDSYTKIRRLVMETKSPILLVNLAKYKNPNDIELIKSFGKQAYSAIQEFPDPKFLPMMKENRNDSSDFAFMLALAEFCSEEAKEIVIKAIEYNKKINKEKDCGGNCLAFLYQQISIKKCTLYDAALADLWVTDKIISFDILDAYEKTHTPKETAKFLLDGFLKPGQAEVIAVNTYDMDHLEEDGSGEMIFDDNLRLVTLLEKAKKISRETYEKAVRNSLQYLDDLDLNRFISKLKDNDSVLQNRDVLLDRVRNNENAYGALNIMDGLKMLKDEKLFNEGAAIIVSRKAEFKKSPVWGENYKNFIRENNIKE